MKYTSNEEHPYGENAIVAVMCFSGYNTEDAILINEGSLHRGLFRTTYYNMYESHEESTKFGSSKIDSKFMNIQNNSVVGQDLEKLLKVIGVQQNIQKEPELFKT